MPDKQGEAWEAIIAQWKSDHKVVCFYENLEPKPAATEAK
jgi:hypothetical protein